MNIIISNVSETPIYQQLKNQIKEAILTGEIQDGELLPSIRNLANETRVSVLTTRRAYDELEEEGFIKTVHGKGTFAISNNLELLKEARLRQVEEKLLEAYQIGKAIGVTKDDMQTMMNILYDENGGS
ncbi:GntR family transcriptional regulator [Candidatus Galacturonibacter soehngenii]|uniref:GntR family transcriptional regulator n=1 Tax=Candidatus Galacturonatibacter soehngenii TaxID=2307010 RepID=A0A7V7QMY8_9FIRM|nr:GntR family transcriptional regulator [Candidatus Galacturonibacter soehngenii]KAB1440144.1 GntR family transcriptional regulator [Candidatus Galacturonibacter soehngenii]MBA4686016.1 GntR family transcriptional regulator [Candidatus Galacturonibacter soehngenii]